MGNNKERRPRLENRRIIKHGPNKGKVDMSGSSPEANGLGGGINVEGLLQEIRQQPSYKSRRYQGPPK